MNNIKDATTITTSETNFSNDFAIISNNELIIHSEENKLVFSIPTINKVFVKKTRIYRFTILSIVISILIVATTLFFCKDKTIMIISFAIVSILLAFGFLIKNHDYQLVILMKENIKSIPIKKENKRNAIAIARKLMKHKK
ncbi:hypothetical protein OX284_010120 [Flavobacterium sp. SUN046]|jgi:hypothetical protein|uniref:hypothetical protein n=1 Tax=Flavobacterium sp. SUN046 TaxID=3002440 RepID=UPI002DB77ACD|nr:hypothetical protein [Flavobacterium sp. SUN046]MEC4049783.1 hypothetical protein [Flavobacterium sp. SUN046]